MRPPRRILFAGGGTGGHIYPALALADDLTARGWSCLFLGTERPAERRIMEKSPFVHVPLPTGYLRKSLRGAASFGVRLTAALGLAVHLVMRFRPQVCVGLGGYGSVPGVVACRAGGIPVALFEPNSVAGKANRLLEPLAREVWTWFPSAGAGFRNQARVVRTGIPLRSHFRQPLPAAERPGGRVRVLVLGGSQGARGLNRLMTNALPALAGAGF